jgi:hypothetical protein
MADRSARAERVGAIVETHGGMLGLICDIVGVEIPADAAPSLAMLWDGAADISVSGIPVRDRLPRVRCLRCRLGAA